MVRDLEGGDIFGTGSLPANEVARFRTPLSFEREVHYVTFGRTPGKPLFVFFIMVVSYKDWELLNSRISMAKIVIDRY